MNWYRRTMAQMTPHWQSAKNDLSSIKEMIENWGGSKGIDAVELNRMIQEAENYLKRGHDAEQVRAVMRDRLRAA